MKIVNPKLDKFGEGLQLEEPFMLWCDEQKRYHTAVARLWLDALGGSRDDNDIIVGSTQAPDHILRHFTIGNKDKQGNDIFRSIDELLLLFKYGRYELLYRG